MGISAIVLQFVERGIGLTVAQVGMGHVGNLQMRKSSDLMYDVLTVAYIHYTPSYMHHHVCILGLYDWQACAKVNCHQSSSKKMRQRWSRRVLRSSKYTWREFQASAHIKKKWMGLVHGEDSGLPTDLYTIYPHIQHYFHKPSGNRQSDG